MAQNNEEEDYKMKMYGAQAMVIEKEEEIDKMRREMDELRRRLGEQRRNDSLAEDSLPNMENTEALKIMDDIFRKGPIVYGSIVIRNHTEEIYLSDYNEKNREALKKWIMNEKLPYDFNYITAVVKETERSSETVEDMQKVTRNKMKAIFDVNVFDDKVIQNVHWQVNNICLPTKFDIVMSHFCLTNVCQTQEGFLQALRRTVGLIDEGGYIILAGFLKFPEYGVGDVIYKELSQTLEEITEALKICGMATTAEEGFAVSQFHYDPEKTKNDLDYHELHGEYVLISKKL